MADSTLNKFLSRGTAAARAAFTPSPPTPASGASPTYIWHETDTGLTYAWDGSAWDQIGVVGSLSDGDKGDITVSSSGAAWAIDNDVVTYAKMQNASAGNVALARAAATSGDFSEVALAASRLLGRGSTGDIAAISLDAGLEFNGTVIRTARGTSFPGSPASGDRFLRTDRNIDYFYDGTRWLSTTQHQMVYAMQDGLTPFTATSQVRAPHPFSGLYDIYVERVFVESFITTTTATNHFSVQFNHSTGAASTNIGAAISTQSITQNSWTHGEAAVNAVVASTVNIMSMAFTETGTCSGFLIGSVQYRLVG